MKKEKKKATDNLNLEYEVNKSSLQTALAGKLEM